MFFLYLHKKLNLKFQNLSMQKRNKVNSCALVNFKSLEKKSCKSYEEAREKKSD